jgi:hypothetical protein
MWAVNTEAGSAGPRHRISTARDGRLPAKGPYRPATEVKVLSAN